VVEFISAYIERNKNFFRKIENFHFLPTFFAEKWAKNGGTDYQNNRKWVAFFSVQPPTGEQVSTHRG
jgi:hypothetical protein